MCHQLVMAIGLLLLSARVLADATYTDPVSGVSGRYHIKQKPSDQGVIVFLHGSGGAANYDNLLPILATVGRAYQLAAMAVQVPNQRDTWAEPAHGTTFHHASYLKGLLSEALKNKFPHLAKGRYVFVGLSAGSTFLSGDFLPDYIQDYPGGSAVLLCGGGPPLTASASKPVTGDFKMEVVITVEDFLYNQTLDAVRYWRNRRVPVNLNRLQKGGHCAFDIEQELKAALQRLLTER